MRIDERTSKPNSAQVDELINLVEQLKVRGNTALTSGDHLTAIDLYTQGINAAMSRSQHSKTLLSQLYSNRAAAKLLLNHFEEVVDDCRKAISVDSTNLKAYWRAAKASIHQELFQQAIEFCEDGLKVDASHGDIQTLRRMAESRLCKHTSGTSRGFTEDDAVNAQTLVGQLAEQHYIVRQKIHAHELEIARNSRTLTVIGQVPNTTPLYKTLGRGFILSSRDVIVDDIKNRSCDIRDSILPTLHETREGIEKRKENAENELKEIVSFFRNRQSSTATSM
jgi:chaperonin cofactor prefoldin